MISELRIILFDLTVAMGEGDSASEEEDDAGCDEFVNGPPAGTYNRPFH